MPLFLVCLNSFSFLSSTRLESLHIVHSLFFLCAPATFDISEIDFLSHLSVY